MPAWKGLIVALAALIGLAAAPASHAQAPAPPILEAPAVLGLPEASHASVRRFLNRLRASRRSCFANTLRKLDTRDLFGRDPFRVLEQSNHGLGLDLPALHSL